MSLKKVVIDPRQLFLANFSNDNQKEEIDRLVKKIKKSLLARLKNHKKY